MPVVVTIDGPVGSGKSTVSRKLANKLGFIHLNVGDLFRALALEASDRGLDLGDENALTKLAKETAFSCTVDESGNTKVCVNDNDFGNRLRTQEAGQLASRIAVFPLVREVLSAVQQDVARGHSVVVEGRDGGTVVFPSADAKFYLDASLDVRARRRFDELSERVAGAAVPSTFETVRGEIEERDRRDRTRSVAPLTRAEDAMLVDTSEMTVDDVVEKICDVVRERCSR